MPSNSCLHKMRMANKNRSPPPSIPFISPIESVNAPSSCKDFGIHGLSQLSRHVGCLGFFLGSGLCSPAIAVDRPIDDILYDKAILNAPSDDFWYPPYLIGKWNTTLTFSDATFTEKFSLDELSRNDNLPGFSPYSVVFCPDMGKNVNLIRRFVQIDSHPREDHPFNIREIFRAFLNEEVIVESAAYSFQKAPDWFHSPANRWKIAYRDGLGRGDIQLVTQKRDIQVTAGSVETTEFFHQEHRRYENGAEDKGKLTASDYALHWKLG